MKSTVLLIQPDHYFFRLSYYTKGRHLEIYGAENTARLAFEAL